MGSAGRPLSTDSCRQVGAGAPGGRHRGLAGASPVMLLQQLQGMDQPGHGSQRDSHRWRQACGQGWRPRGTRRRRTRHVSGSSCVDLGEAGPSPGERTSVMVGVTRPPPVGRERGPSGQQVRAATRGPWGPKPPVAPRGGQVVQHTSTAAGSRQVRGGDGEHQVRGVGIHGCQQRRLPRSVPVSRATPHGSSPPALPQGRTHGSDSRSLRTEIAPKLAHEVRDSLAALTPEGTRFASQCVLEGTAHHACMSFSEPRGHRGSKESLGENEPRLWRPVPHRGHPLMAAVTSPGQSPAPATESLSSLGRLTGALLW